MNMPPIGELRHLLDRLKSNDIAWFRDSFKSGKLAWLKDHLPGDGYEKLGERIEAGDLGHVKSVLGGIDLPGVDLFKGIGGAGAAAAAAATGAVGAAASGAMKGGIGAAKGASDALKGGVGSAKGAVGSTASAATGIVDRKRKGGLLWLLPLLIAAVILALVLSKCNKDKTTSTSNDTKAADSVAVDTASVSTAVAAPIDSAAPATDAKKPADSAAPAAATKNIVDTALGAGNFNTLAKALDAGGLSETLKGAGPFTVFAPTDDAFAKLPAGVLDKLLLPANKDALAKVLSYHVLQGSAVKAADVKSGPAKSVEGSDLTLVSEGGKVTVDGANVVAADVATSNGVIHAIDTVLVPKDLDLATLKDGSAVDTTPAAAPADIVGVAAANGSFTTLVKAVEAAGLVDTLKGPGPFTVFAPTDDAFKALDPALLDKLLLPENKESLSKLLTYHVISGTVKAADVKTGPVKTVEGSDASLVADGAKVSIEGANVVTADVAASNGIIHVIDKVIVPKDLDLSTLTGTAAATTALPTDTAVVNAAGDATPEDLTVYFASGSANLNSEAKAKIDKAVVTLSSLAAGSKVNIVGHADKNGDAAFNQSLSEKRAGNVQDALKAGLGDKAGNITFTTSAKGDTEQAANLAKSRRVTIEIQK